MSSQIDRYVAALAGFKGGARGNFDITLDMIKERHMELAVPSALTDAQRDAISDSVDRARQLDISVEVTCVDE